MTTNNRFGAGWMSKNAADLARLAIFAGFEPEEIVREIWRLTRNRPYERVNAPTVEQALARIQLRYHVARYGVQGG